ncbi:MAG TPA: UDP-3-O-(3-hydroxymyristoyl)glucosamine N-acyltransferase [Saprospiraceae bacterium]|nr:UDP-3-O-(3-hydroxymyristoyl)glucosamine N-acyltransferase [Saprospiraceae bacterium]
MNRQLSEIAELIGAEYSGHEDMGIYGLAKIEEGKPGYLSFIANDKFESFLYTTQSSAVIVKQGFEPKQLLDAKLLYVDDVYSAVAKVSKLFAHTHDIEVGISPLTYVATSSSISESPRIAAQSYIGKNCTIGKNVVIYPQVFIDDHCTIGDNVVLYSGVKIYHNCIIGNNVILHSNAVIGSDGFGFASSAEVGISKIEQLGNVVLGNDVEIGAGSTIDRATMGSTRLGNFVKIDNLVHIAHNVQIGDYTFIAAQTGVAGSTKIGKCCMIGGQVGILGHIEIADFTSIQAKSGIGGHVKNSHTKLYGYPAIDYSAYLKSYAYFKQLPEMAQKLRKLENKLADN